MTFSPICTMEIFCCLSKIWMSGGKKLCQNCLRNHYKLQLETVICCFSGLSCVTIPYLHKNNSVYSKGKYRCSTGVGHLPPFSLSKLNTNLYRRVMTGIKKNVILLCSWLEKISITVIYNVIQVLWKGDILALFSATFVCCTIMETMVFIHIW